MRANVDRYVCLPIISFSTSHSLHREHPIVGSSHQEQTHTGQTPYTLTLDWIARIWLGLLAALRLYPCCVVDVPCFWIRHLSSPQHDLGPEVYHSYCHPPFDKAG